VLELLSAWTVGRAGAQVTTEQPASILVFPKVIVDDASDTVIQISTASPLTARVWCFYVDAVSAGAGTSPGLLVTDFALWLSKQQPVSWVVSAGRPAVGPGPVPSITGPFRGELLCVETGAEGTPLGGHHLTGIVTLKHRQNEDIAKYSAIGFLGTDFAGETGLSLPLGGSGSDRQYDGCPAEWRLDHLADGAEDPQIGPGSSVRTHLTIVPCSHDLITFVPARVTVVFEVTNEFEEVFFASMPVEGWFDGPLSSVSDVFSASRLGTLAAQTRMRPALGDPGFLVVGQEFHQSGGPAVLEASAAVNAHGQGTRDEPDFILLP